MHEILLKIAQIVIVGGIAAVLLYFLNLWEKGDATIKSIVRILVIAVVIIWAIFLLIGMVPS